MVLIPGRVRQHAGVRVHSCRVRSSLRHGVLKPPIWLAHRLVDWAWANPPRMGGPGPCPGLLRASTLCMEPGKCCEAPSQLLLPDQGCTIVPGPLHDLGCSPDPGVLHDQACMWVPGLGTPAPPPRQTAGPAQPSTLCPGRESSQLPCHPQPLPSQVPPGPSEPQVLNPGARIPNHAAGADLSGCNEA